MLWSGQGPVHVGPRDANGNRSTLRTIASCNIEVDLQTQTTDHHESDTGERLQDGRLQTGKSATIKLTTDHWDIENLALGLYSTSVMISGSTVTAEQLPNPVALGDIIGLQQQDISNLIISDSAGTPVQLVENTDYQIESAKHGTVKFIADLSGYTQPLTADYTYAGGTNLAIFDTPPIELWVRADVINTGASGNPASLVEFYRCILDPIGALNVKSNDYGPLEMTGVVMYDPTKVNDTTLGQFGRIIQMA